MPPHSRRLRTIVVVIASLGTGLAAAQATQQTQTPPVKGTGFLLGQVIDAGTNKPVPGATVNLGGSAVTTTMLPSGEIFVNPGLPAGATSPRQILTDGNGRFLFREINQGTYTLRASAPGYIVGLYGQYRPSGGSQSIVIDRDDEKKTGLVIRVWQSGTISGRIVDELGDPAVGVSARLVRRTFAGGRLRLAPSLTASTDDRGVYRLTGIGPGDYLVGVFATATTLPAPVADAYLQNPSAAGEEILREAQVSGAPYPFTSGFRIGDLIFSGEGTFGRIGSGMLPPPLDDGRVLAYPTVFYPTANTPQQATVITIGSGDDRVGIDFQLRLRRTVSVSGFVTGPDGPMKNVGLKLLPAGAEDFASLSGVEAAVTATDVSGAFTFLGVSPGTYAVQCIRVPRAQPPRSASPMMSMEVTGPNGMMMGISTSGPGLAPTLPLPADPALWGGMSVTVGESDIQGLGIVLRPGARLSGKIVFEGGSELPPPDLLQRTNISISPMGGVMPTQVTSAQKRVEGDGTFKTMGYPPGRYSVSASLPPPPAGRGGGPAPASWRLKGATLGGRDLTDEGLEIQNADIAGIVLTFTDRPTEITGSVVDAKSQPDLSAMVVVIPADSIAWKNAIVSPARVRGARTTSTGGFTIANLPPGEYFIAAVSDASLDNWQDAKNLESITRVAARITLGDGAKISQRLTTVTIK